MKVPLGALLLTPLWIVWQARRAGRKHRAHPGAVAAPSPIGLPPDLQFLAFPAGLRLQLRMDTAHVLETQVWSETSVSWQSSSAPPGQAPHVSVTTRTTQKERLWVETMDGRQEAWTFSGGVFEAMQGQVVSWIQYVRREGSLQPVLFYNHATDRHHEFDWWPTLHGHALAAWFWVMLLWVGPWTAVAHWLALEAQLRASIWAPSLVLLAVATFALTVMIRFWIHGGRRRRWRKQHRVRLLELLQRFSRGLRPTPNAGQTPSS